MEEWSKYITVENVTLLIAILTLLVALATYCVTKRSYNYTRKRDKKQIEDLIRSKEAQLKAMELSSRMGVSHTEMGSVMMNQAALRAEIEQLKASL